MTYTFSYPFISIRSFFIFFIQIIPILVAIYFPLNRRFPLLFPIKRILLFSIENIVFNIICSFLFFKFFNCVMVYYASVLSFSFFQISYLQRLITRKINKKGYFYFVIDLFINLFLMSFMNYIRLFVYSYFSSEFYFYYFIELIPLFFPVVILLTFKLLDRLVQDSIFIEKFTILTTITFFGLGFFNIYPQFISLFSFSANPRIFIFKSFLFKDKLFYYFPNVEIIIYQETTLLYNWAILFSFLGLFLLVVNIAGLIILNKRRNYAEALRRENELLEYILVIEDIVQKTQKYQHDFKNILLTLKNYIDSSSDISDDFRNYFQKILHDFNINTITIDVSRIENIKIKEIFSLILGKYQYAKLKNINIQIDVPNEVNFTYFDTLIYCKVIGILIDNALNASLLCQTPMVNISLISDETMTVFIIENNTVNPNVISDIKNSSGKIKKDGHGYGMTIVQTIIDDYQNISLESSQYDELFKQTLSIFKN